MQARTAHKYFQSQLHVATGRRTTLRRVIVASRAQMHARPPCGAQLDIERRFKNLLEQLPLIDDGRRADSQARPVVQQHNLVGEFRRERKFVRHDHDGVFVLFGKLPQSFEQFHLRADIEMQRRLIEQNQPRLLRQRTRQDNALLFAAGQFPNRPVGEVLGTHLRERVTCNRDVFGAREMQRPAVRMAPLQNEIPGTRGV